MNFNSEPITRAQALAFWRCHFWGHMPQAAAYYAVSGVQYPHNLPGLFLVAGELGLQGVYMVGMEARAA